MKKIARLIVAFGTIVLYIWFLSALNEANAKDFNVYASVASWHTSGDYNQVNPGLGFRNDISQAESGKLSAVWGGYYNSERNISAYGGIEGSFGVMENITVGVDVVAVTGYERGSFVAPLPFVEIGRLRTMIIPQYKETPLTLGFMWRF